MSSKGMNTHLKGRKRYAADLKSVQEGVLQRRHMMGLDIQDLQIGEEEGSFHCHISHTGGKHLVSLSFLVSDASEYPGDHTFFCHSLDDNVAALIMQVVESVPEEGSCTIDEMLNRVRKNIAKALARQSGTEDQSEDEDALDDFNAFDDDDDDFGFMPSTKKIVDMKMLQNDFHETVACGYRPGFIPIGVDEFVLSIAIPIIALTRDIPARALVAWDRHLLARTQHLTLLIYGFRGTYPILQGDGTLRTDAVACGAAPQFRVGLTAGHKPRQDHVIEIMRVFGLQEVVPEAPKDESKLQTWPPDDLDESDGNVEPESAQSTEPEPEESDFERASFQTFSLSSSLETLLNQYFLRVLQLRLQYDLGWAGAEILCWEAERTQQKPQDIFRSMRQNILDAEQQETELSNTYDLPPDPLLSRERVDHINLPLIAFCYLKRRLMLCTRYCIVCQNKLHTDYEALKPYVCDSKLCTYQYYNLNRGPSLEYEICANAEAVDLLVSLTYVAAAERVLSDPLPTGMGLRVFPPDPSVPIDQDGLCEFDTLSQSQMCSVIVRLIDTLPPVLDMKRHLRKPAAAGRIKPRLQDMDRSIPNAAWSILRWCVGSCTAHLEELQLEEDRIQNIDPSWRQFRFSTGAPDAEAKYKGALETVQSRDPNALRYPSLFAFHGSPVRNWHSIIRHGLWYKQAVNGRAYGNGVYFAKEGSVSMSTYAGVSGIWWSNSSIGVQQCVALAEIVNSPARFVSKSPYFVVADTHWIICRYLLVKSAVTNDKVASPIVQPIPPEVPFVQLDPAHSITLSNKHIRIPEPAYRLEKLLAARQAEFFEIDYDEDDMTVFECQTDKDQPQAMEQLPPFASGMFLDDWVHDYAWVNATVEHLLPPPSEATPQSTMALQRELKAMLREQGQAKSLKELGWFMPPDFVGDNLFQWIVELHSFDPELPVAQDMAARDVNSLVFEIRFPPSFPHSPPFFRIIKPRFLPFIHGGGGHVTGGGSMCMDLLTADGWLPSYSISAILLQIKLAISNLDPRPARLAQNWDTPYGMQEALEGYKRAATTHGWKIPGGLERLTYG